MSNSTPTFPKLNNSNYNTWSGDMQAWLMSKELRMLVDNEEPCPPATDTDSRVKWSKRAQKAAGEIYLAFEIRNLTFMAFSMTQFASGRLYATYTCLRSQEHDSTHMTTCFPSGNYQMNPCCPSVLESISLCKTFKIFDQVLSL